MTRPDAQTFPEISAAIGRLRRSWHRYWTWHYLDKAYGHAMRSEDARLRKAIAAAIGVNLGLEPNDPS